MNHKNKKAFTVAEIIITLSILGILVVLTIPRFAASVDAMKTKTAIKKGFELLSSAYRMTYGTESGPKTKEDGDLIMSAINSKLAIQYYLICDNNNKCTTSHAQGPVGSWAINEDNIAFKVIKGNTNCANKASLAALASSKVTTELTCLAVMIDAGCIAKTENPAKCSEIPDDKRKITSNEFKGTQARAFVGQKSIASGSSENTAMGIIISGTK